MSGKRSLEIKSQFDRYLRIKDCNKKIPHGELFLSVRRDDPRYEVCEAAISADDEMLTLRCDAKRDILRSLHIQLFCKNLQQDPCYRFESSGKPHTNKKGPLRNRRIPTPHFHEYDESGWVVAYQTSEIVDPDKDLLQSRDAVLSHFCEIHNIDFDGSSMKISPATLFPPEDSLDDCLKGVPFDE